MQKKSQNTADHVNIHVAELQEELQRTKVSLQASIEELEISNEELKSTNEELQSTNEELQSTNEELETSKEEQNSLNEELAIVNNELQKRIDRIIADNSEIRSLFDNLDIAVVLLDHKSNIRMFTSGAKAIINLISTDIGRPLHHIVNNITNLNLNSVAEQAITNKRDLDKGVITHNGDEYQMKLRLQKRSTGVIKGIIITFEKISLGCAE